ncbi:MAG: haloacid dehalogenase type II [Kiloniellaceae bacterium]
MEASAMAVSGVKALTFDVFGTVVDWRGGIIAEAKALGEAKGLSLDWEAFVDDWKSCYRAGMDRVNSGEIPWMTVDEIYRAKLDELLVAYGITGLCEAETARFNRVWHRLDAWPDAVEGLVRLKRKFVLSTLSNGSFACLVDMAKHAGLPWDCVLSAENVRRYKPAPEVYLMAIELLGQKPEQVMMVAAHNDDLTHAAAHGMRAAFIPRPTEYGPDQTSDLKPEGDWDIIADSMAGLADALGA